MILDLNWSVIVSVAIYILGLAVVWGSMKSTLSQHGKELEKLSVIPERMAVLEAQNDELTKKTDKHNNFMERLGTVEASSKAGHKRLDENNAELNEVKEKIVHLTTAVELLDATVNKTSVKMKERGLY